MKSFFYTNQCMGEKLVEAAGHTYHIRKIHTTKTEEQDDSFEYYLLDSNRQVLASYHAKLEESESENCVLHLYNGYVSTQEKREKTDRKDLLVQHAIDDRKENMKNLSILFMDSFADLDQITYHGRIIVDRTDSQEYTKFQLVCMHFDDNCFDKTINYINKNDNPQEDIAIQRDNVAKLFKEINCEQSQNGFEAEK